MSSSSALADANEVFLVYSKEPGSMHVENIGSALRALGFNPSDVDVQGYITEADYDGSGTIDLSTFRDIVQQQEEKPKATQEELEKAFVVFDKDGKGSIPTEELRYMITKLGEALTEEECTEMIKQVDADGSGTIELHEFAAMM
ncbi:calmodulin [Salpingoeca rosetta]|uniref:Calmodulin n=1 Tax=Salpingoeca rosetta (strain ATCC 50818 / BSB-021) TaxID=946362 RepID=F2TYG2_SALR5|nr:calmodulin [Salpingoeca rosetta]EGD78636.1 calmodulin [Salpingoeca rosetta]|eukprot:XP_004997594.1 calmodulin [Salpingoeca rosetta]